MDNDTQKDEKVHDVTDGPIKKRKTQDIFFAILFILYWIGMIAIAILAINQGNIKRLSYGIDSDGHLCGDINEINGTSTNLTDQRVLFYFSPQSLQSSYKRCLFECPMAGDTVCKYGVSYKDEVHRLLLLASGDCVQLLFNTTSCKKLYLSIVYVC